MWIEYIANRCEVKAKLYGKKTNKNKTIIAIILKYKNTENKIKVKHKKPTPIDIQTYIHTASTRRHEISACFVLLQIIFCVPYHCCSITIILFICCVVFSNITFWAELLYYFPLFSIQPFAGIGVNCECIFFFQFHFSSLFSIWSLHFRIRSNNKRFFFAYFILIALNFCQSWNSNVANYMYVIFHIRRVPNFK